MGHLHPIPGVWYSLKLSASPTLPYTFSEYEKPLKPVDNTRRHNALDPLFLREYVRSNPITRSYASEKTPE
jgi:hypothetical protein